MRKVEAGQRLRQTAPPQTAWEVLEAVLDQTGVRHLRIRSLGDPTNVKLISEHTLADDRIYRVLKGQ